MISSRSAIVVTTSTMPDPVTEDQPRRRPRLIGLLVLALCVGLLGFAIVSLSIGNGGGEDIKITGAEEVVVPLIAGPVRDGDLQLVYHYFPMTESGFFLGAYAAVAAAKQDYEWQFIELFFANQDEAEKHGADQEFLDNIARGVGVVNF